MNKKMLAKATLLAIISQEPNIPDKNKYMQKKKVTLNRQHKESTLIIK